MNIMDSVLSRTYPTATILVGNQTKSDQHLLARMNDNYNAALVAQAIRDGIFNGSESYEKTASGILVSKTEDRFVHRPELKIFMPERNSGIILV